MPAQDGLPVLMCHDLTEQRAAIALSPGVFRNGLAHLRRAGFRTISLVEVADCLRAAQDVPSAQGRSRSSRGLPENAFAITFDDGSESVYTQGFPVLQQLGFSATVFITVGEKPVTTSQARLPPHSERTMLSWGQIREMQRHGIAFGAHTLTHPNLTRLPPDQAEAEIANSQAIIADALGVAVPTFAYPFGYYDRRIQDIVRKYFACACSVHLRLVTTRSDLYALERIDSHYVRTQRTFAVMASPRLRWYLLARAVPRHIRRMVQRRVG